MNFLNYQKIDIKKMGTKNVYSFYLWPMSHAIFFFKYGASNRNDYYLEIVAKFGIEIDYLKRIEKYL